MTKFDVDLETDRQMTFDQDIVKEIVQGERVILPAGTTDRWYNFPSAQGTCQLTNGQTARGSWVDYDWPNNETSALQTALSRLYCIGHSEEELENHMVDLFEWNPEIPTVWEDPVSKQASLVCHHLW